MKGIAFKEHEPIAWSSKESKSNYRVSPHFLFRIAGVLAMRFFATSFLLPLAFLVTATAADPTPEPEDSNDAKTIVGTWEVVKATKEGTPAPANEVNGMKMIITKDSMTIQMPNKGGRDEAVKYTLDMKSKPRGINLTLSRGNGVQETIKGIYKIDKGQLTICFSKNMGDRPTTFDEKARTVVVMRKEKAKK